MSELRNYFPGTFFRWIVLLVAIGVMFRLVRYGVRMPLWGDEAMLGVNFLQRIPGNLFEPLEFGQVLPAGYLMLTWLLTQVLGFSELVLRLPSVICSIATVFLLYWFVSRRFSSVQVVCMMGLLAVSYYVVRHGAEFKPYAADALVSLLLLVATVQVHTEEPSFGRRLTFVLSIMLAPLFSFPSVFVAASCLCTLFGSAVIEKDRAQLRMVAVTGFVSLLTFTGYYYSYIVPHGEANPVLFSYWQGSFPPDTVLEFPLWLGKQLAGNMLAYPIPSSKFGAFTLVLCIIGIWRFVKARDWFLLWILLLPFGITLAASVLHLYPFGGSARIAQHLVPSVMILAGVGLAWLISLRSDQEGVTRTQAIVFSVMLLLGIAGMLHTLVKPYKSEGALEVRRMVEDLVNQEHCSPIYVFNEKEQVPINFRWYLGIDQRAILGATGYTNKNDDSTVCMMLFDEVLYPDTEEIFNRLLAELEPGNVTIRRGTAHIYRGEEHPHTYAIAIVQ